MKKLKKIITVLIIFSMLFTQFVPMSVLAEEPLPTETPVVTQPPAVDPSPTVTDQNPTPALSPEPTVMEVSPTPTVAPQEPAKTPEQLAREAEKKKAEEEFITAYIAAHPESDAKNNEELRKKAEAAFEAQYNAAQQSYSNQSAPTPIPPQVESQPDHTGTISNGNVGDTVISTGDSGSNSTSASIGNNNLSGQPAIVGTENSASPVEGSQNGASIVNAGNGASSDNNAQSAQVANNNSNQNNSAQVSNTSNQSSNSGSNQSSYNSGNTIINTGDSNTSGTAITAVNTNVDGLMVSEFNIADDHKGDLILSPEAFAANCISGCLSPANVSNSGNGANSTNNAGSNSTVNNSTFQSNDAAVGNNMTLSANSGSNDSSYNTGGDTIINTGNANVSANSLTFANNNFAGGNVQYGVVNIYGTLEGDIIIPGYTIANPSAGLNVTNANNGALSVNNANITSENNNNTFQANDAVITNELVLNAQTGNNASNGNTQGESTIKTGNTNVDANVVNIANSNLNGGDWVLVIINNAGKWVGKLLGAPDGATMAGSAGTEFAVDPTTGQVNVSNNGNGAMSDNNANLNSQTNSTTNQTNNAVINNKLDLSAATGANTANYNTGGNNYVQTGDANIIANMVNFVNNNVVGGGILRVVVVNVFKEWLGDIVMPGQEKQNKDQELAQNPSPSASPEIPADNSSNNTTSAQQENNTSSPTPGTSNTGQVAGASSSIQVSPPAIFSAKAKVNGTAKINYKYRSHKAPVQVAGIKTVNKKLLANAASTHNKSAQSKGVSLNLAWLVIIVPSILIIILGRRFLMIRLSKKIV